MSDDNKFFGLTKNRTELIGRVVGDPQLIDSGDNEIAFFRLKTVDSHPDSNGQYVQKEQLLPIYEMNSNRVERLIKPHVQDGRQLVLDCYYDSWVNNGVDCHGFIIISVQLGVKAYVQKMDS